MRIISLSKWDEQKYEKGQETRTDKGLNVDTEYPTV